MSQGFDIGKDFSRTDQNDEFGQSRDKGPKKSLSQSRSRFLRIFCNSMHVLLVLLHLALLLVWIYHKEHRVVVSLTKSARVSTIVVAVLQVFITIYSMVLVVSTQQLALRRTLLKHQTLTATHDISNAWSGLGSAFVSLWRQYQIVAAVIGTLSVTVYLSCIAILHITTPSLFNMQPFNNTGTAAVPTTIGMPNITYNESLIGQDGSFEFWADTTSLLPYLSRVNQMNTLGVYNGSVFDVLDQNNGVGNVTVGATAFNVTCGSLPNATVASHLANSPTTIGTNLTSEWDIQVTWDTYTIDFNVNAIAPNVLRQVPYNLRNMDNYTQPLLPRDMIFYLSSNISDSDGNHGTGVTLQPPMVLTTGVTVYNVQILGCTLSLTDQQAIVDAQTRSPLSLDPTIEKTSSKWNTWLPEQIGPRTPSIVDGWGDMFGLSQLGPTFTAYLCSADNAVNCDKLTYTEQYLMEKLGMYPAYNGTFNATVLPTLDQLENALANLTASLFWAAGNIPQDKFDQPSETVTQAATKPITLSRGQAFTAITEARLNLNAVPVIIGLVASIVLLVVCYILIRNPDGHESTLDNMGILQIMWLGNRRPQLQEVVAQVDEPTIHNLRAAGMVRTRLADRQPPLDETQIGRNEYSLVGLDAKGQEGRV